MIEPTCLRAMQAARILSRRFSAVERIEWIRPVPMQWGQTRVWDSWSGRPMFWRVISSRPNWDSEPMLVLARSLRNSRRTWFSSLLRLSSESMSMKSITIRPARLRSLSWVAISVAASMLVLKAVFSMLAWLRERLELMSIATIASVVSITSSPPERSWILRVTRASSCLIRPSSNSSSPSPTRRTFSGEMPPIESTFSFTSARVLSLSQTISAVSWLRYSDRQMLTMFWYS